MKIMEYDNAMQGFATQRDKVKMKSAPKPPPVVPDESDVKKTLHEKTINSLPTNLQPTAKNFWNELEIMGINASFPSLPVEKYQSTDND